MRLMAMHLWKLLMHEVQVLLAVPGTFNSHKYTSYCGECNGTQATEHFCWLICLHNREVLIIF